MRGIHLDISVPVENRLEKNDDKLLLSDSLPIPNKRLILNYSLLEF